jgi:hypothetical protein
MHSVDSSFDRAVVATLYLLGERGADLANACGAATAPVLLGALGSTDRQVRLAALASELAKIGVALEAGAFS